MTLNLSFVLHERSTGEHVAATAARCVQHASRIANLRDSLLPPATCDPAGRIEPADFWLTATLGNVDRLAEALTAAAGTQQRIMCVDAAGAIATSFFRAPAQLQLPSDDVERVGVAALVLRPDGRSSHLRVVGQYSWPREHGDVIRAVEMLVQAYADQWTPVRALWLLPAEQMLAEEIG